MKRAPQPHRSAFELDPLPVIEHALTHFDWRLHPRRARLLRKPAQPLPGPGRWIEHAALAQIALPAPLRRLLEAK